VSWGTDARDRLIVALDVPEAAEARALAARLRGRVGALKVGSQLFTAAGPGLVKELVAGGDRVFLDLKYHDIPNTVAGAVASAVRLDVALLTVHALGGRAMLESAVEARGSSATRLLAITILTSHDEAVLQQLGVRGPVSDAALRLARVAAAAGIDGVVASPQEARAIRAACGPGLLIVTPGVRPAGAARGDQSRVATPAEALAAGADRIVVGRPVTAAPDPASAADAIVAELATASQ
jgi:orotidine-5'-phosphate decarboxylase